MSLLSVHDLCVERRSERVLDGVSFEIGAGECVGLIGPNGAGKTTLLRALLGLLPFRGRSTLAALSHSRRAKEVAWMPQSREIAWPVTVETVVMLGRTPHAASLGRPGAQDIRAVETALDRMELTAMRDRPATELSGGEQARVLIARALAQETPLLLADEPIAGLDPAHQIATMQTFAALAAQGKSCLVSLHDLGLAGRHCTRLILLGQGGLVADGPPAEVLSPDLLARIFGITAFCQQTDQGLLCQPLEVIR